MAQSEKTLMAKTKKELVAIILRKDDVEIKLQNQVKALEEENQGIAEQLKATAKDAAEAERSARNAKVTIQDIDLLNKDLHLTNIKLESKVKLYKCLAILCGIIAVGIGVVTLFS